MKTNKDSCGSLAEIRKMLLGYGQDFATKGLPPGVQPWASLELGVVMLAIIAWLAKTVFKTIIEHSLKERLHSKNTSMSIGELKTRVDKLEQEIDELLSHKIIDDNRLRKLEDDLKNNLSSIRDERLVSINFSLDDIEGLSSILHKLGLTKRKSIKLANDLKVPLEKLVEKGKNP
jgi:hypothetical protein